MCTGWQRAAGLGLEKLVDLPLGMQDILTSIALTNFISDIYAQKTTDSTGNYGSYGENASAP